MAALHLWRSKFCCMGHSAAMASPSIQPRAGIFQPPATLSGPFPNCAAKRCAISCFASVESGEVCTRWISWSHTRAKLVFLAPINWALRFLSG